MINYNCSRCANAAELMFIERGKQGVGCDGIVVRVVGGTFRRGAVAGKLRRAQANAGRPRQRRPTAAKDEADRDHGPDPAPSRLRRDYGPSISGSPAGAGAPLTMGSEGANGIGSVGVGIGSSTGASV